MAKKAPENLKILMVDDESLLLESLSDNLKETEYEILCANSGKEALELLDQHGHSIVLVISDYMMPEMNGLEFRSLALEKWEDIPFVILSAFITKEMALSGIENKIVAFLEKPITDENLLSSIEKHSGDRKEEILEERELREGFIQESELLLEEMEPLITGLESDPQDFAAFDRVFAIVHTIKGTSAFFLPNPIHDFVHKFEDFLTVLKNGTRHFTPDVIAILFKSMDIITKMFESFKERDGTEFNIDELIQIFTFSDNAQADKKAEETTNDASAQMMKEKKLQEVRVSTDLLDEFMGLSGEVTVLRNMIKKLVHSLEKRYGDNKDIVLLGGLLDEMHKINSLLQDKIVDLRKIPLKNVYRPLNRAVRDLSSKLDKSIKLKFIGDDLKVDTSIADVLNNSLVHLIRNCADHGIETPDIRTSLSKPEEGLITIQSVENQENVTISIKDDGRGINPELVKKKALENELCTEEELQRMSPSKIFSLILEPGFSTAQQVTDLSGRGVGTDMVKGSVERIGGWIDIYSEINKGSEFVLNLPIPKSVVIISTLFISVRGSMFAISRDHIVRLLKLDDENHRSLIRKLDSSEALELDNELLPIVRLEDILQLEREQKNEPKHLIVLRSKTLKYALLVDEIHEIEDTVLKSLDRSFHQLKIFSGATFLGDGSVGLILDVDGIGEVSGIEEFTKEINEQSFTRENEKEVRSYLSFSLNAKGSFAIDLSHVYRLENIEKSDIQYIGDQAVTIYRNRSMPIFDIQEILGLDGEPSSATREHLPCFIIDWGGHFAALYVEEILDPISSDCPLTDNLSGIGGIHGNIICNETTYNIIDIEVLLKKTKIFQFHEPKSSRKNTSDHELSSASNNMEEPPKAA